MHELPPLDPVPGRKKPAGGVKILSGQPTIVFLTVCAKDRVPWMAQRAVQESLEEIWRKADAWLVGTYLLMPDHLHLFCAPRDLHFTIEQWLTFWKREFSRKHLSENWPRQRNGFHHRLRDPREYEDKWRYVEENPVRKGLVTRPEDWPFQGMLHPLRW
jgi:putative transposase